MESEQRKQAVAQIQQALPDLEWTLQAPKVKRMSRDFHWFSPVLKRQLEDKQADAVVRPRDEEELRLLVAACVQHQLPLIMRGGATGNYGQLVPLEGGILVDMSSVMAQYVHRPGSSWQRLKPTPVPMDGSCAVCRPPIVLPASAACTVGALAV
jgi:hypothetical protein